VQRLVGYVFAMCCVCVYKMVMFMHKLKNKTATISKSICEMLNSFSGLEPIGVSL